MRPTQAQPLIIQRYSIGRSVTHQLSHSSTQNSSTQSLINSELISGVALLISGVPFYDSTLAHCLSRGRRWSTARLFSSPKRLCRDLEAVGAGGGGDDVSGSFDGSEDGRGAPAGSWRCMVVPSANRAQINAAYIGR